MIKLLMTYSNTEGLEYLLNSPNFKVDVIPKPSPEKFREIIPEYDGLLIRSEVKITNEIISAAKRLKLIVRAGIGVDNIDLDASTKYGIVVMNVPGGNTISAAEHTFGLLLALARNITQAQNVLKSGQWRREEFVGTELCGKVLGLIGLGRIGKEVAKRALSFEMKVIAYDPYVSQEYVQQMGVILVDDIDKLYQEADFISIHTPLNDQTRYMINKNSINKMKQGVRIINCARGGIINEKDLYEAIKSGYVKSAALDVFEKEPPVDSPLLTLENVITTPHLGASTEEAQLKIAQEISQMVVDFFERGVIKNAVNIPSIDFETYKQIKPYFDLMDKLGRFQAQTIDGGIKEVCLEYAGEVCNFNIPMLTASYLKGLLGNLLDIKVNFINAGVLARERGIRIKEIKMPESKDYTTLINTYLISEKQQSIVGGTLFSHQHQRIVHIDNLDVDIIPQGYMLLLKNIDKPGIIGQVGTLLGKNNINIASMQVGRKEVGGEAITIVNTDSAISQEILTQITRIPGIAKAKVIQL